MLTLMLGNYFVIQSPISLWWASYMYMRQITLYTRLDDSIFVRNGFRKNVRIVRQESYIDTRQLMLCLWWQSWYSLDIHCTGMRQTGPGKNLLDIHYTGPWMCWSTARVSRILEQNKKVQYWVFLQYLCSFQDRADTICEIIYNTLKWLDSFFPFKSTDTSQCILTTAVYQYAMPTNFLRL